MTPPPRSPISRRPWLAPLGVGAGWLLFTLMVIAISWGGALLRGQNTSFGSTLLWNMGWLLWAGATFLVARLARRFPLARATLARDLARHAARGVALGLALLGFEFAFAHALKAVWTGAPRPNAFLGFIVYKFHVYFLIYWMILGATRAYDFYAQYRASELLAAQLETRLAEAQLLALKTQLHPHFLFNTHHAIISLMVRHENTAAIRMLTQLSDLLRLTLRAPEKQLTTVREEIAALQLYLGIQRERYGERLQVQLEIDPATLEAELPWLLLQPLVENALKHGIDPRAEVGELHVVICAEGEQLRVSVRDNGPGFPAGFTVERAGMRGDAAGDARKDGAAGAVGVAGIGLRNTHDRLARLYGTRGRLTFHGAEVRVMLPLRFSSAMTAPAS